MIAREQHLVVQQTHAAARMPGRRYDLEIGGEIDRLGTLDADFHERRHPFTGMDYPLGAEMLRKPVMASDVVAVGQKDIFHTAKLFDALNQFWVKARHVDEHVAAVAANQVARCTEGYFAGKAAKIDIVLERNRERSEDIPRE